MKSFAILISAHIRSWDTHQHHYLTIKSCHQPIFKDSCCCCCCMFALIHSRTGRLFGIYGQIKPTHVLRHDTFKLSHLELFDITFIGVGLLQWVMTTNFNLLHTHVCVGEIHRSVCVKERERETEKMCLTTSTIIHQSIECCQMR